METDYDFDDLIDQIRKPIEDQLFSPNPLLDMFREQDATLRYREEAHDADLDPHYHDLYVSLRQQGRTPAEARTALAAATGNDHYA